MYLLQKLFEDMKYKIPHFLKMKLWGLKRNTWVRNNNRIHLPYKSLLMNYEEKLHNTIDNI